MARATDLTRAAVQGAQERLDLTRKQAYAAELWSEAQSRESKLKMDGCVHKTQSDSIHWYRTIQKTEFVEKAGGLVPTPFTEGKYGRRALITKSYHDALIVDPDDLVDSQSDPFADRDDQNKAALGRLCDQVILTGLMDKVLQQKAPLQEDFSTTATQTDAKRHYPVGGLETVTKDICFIPNDKKTGNDTAKANILDSVDQLEDIKMVFRKRNIDDELMVTYTPNMQAYLRKDADFKNAESVYSMRDVAAASGAGKGFMYKNLRFVPINEDALADLSTDGIASAKAGTGDSATYTLRCRAMDNADVSGKTGATLPAKASTAGAVVREVSEVGKGDVIYVWSKRALYFAQRESLTITDKTDNPNWSHAQQKYYRVNFGAMLMDEDFAMVVPIRGRRLA